MDEFRTKQTNPYSSTPEPVQQQVNFSPAATPTPVPDPAPFVYDEPAAVKTQPQPVTLTVPQVAPKAKGIPKVLVIVPLALLLLSSLTGGGLWLHKKQVAKLEAEVESTKQETSTLKSSKFGSSNGQGLSLAGSATGNVAGATDEADVVDSGVFTGQVAIRGEQILFEMYVNTNETGKITSVWTNYGGNKDNLIDQTEKTTEGLAEKQEGYVQMIAIGNTADFKPGSSYMYRTSAKSENGKIYKSGYSIFTLPAAETPQQQSSTGSGL